MSEEERLAYAGGMILTPMETVPEKAEKLEFILGTYKYRYTTGPFLLPKGAGSLDWTVLNNDSTVQRVRVTVFKCPVTSPKTPVPPGALEITLGPGESSHNANTYTVGFAYEITVECNSKLIFPYVSVWPGNFGEVIPGTGINSADFIRTLA
jgi:hypothetical protein